MVARTVVKQPQPTVAAQQDLSLGDGCVFGHRDQAVGVGFGVLFRNGQRIPPDQQPADVQVRFVQHDDGSVERAVIAEREEHADE